MPRLRHSRRIIGKLLPLPLLFVLVLGSESSAQQGELPPDASHMPDVDAPELPAPAKSGIPELPSWGTSEPALRARLWPGNPGSPADPADAFVPELQLPPEVDPTLIPDLYLADYFGTLPESLLVDAQTLLSAHERSAIKRALDEHLDNHDVPVYLLVFQEEQKIPEFQNLDALQTRWFGDRPGVVIGFWLGAPTKTKAYFGHTLRKLYRDRLDRAFAAALAESYPKSYAFAQLDNFTFTLLWQLAHLDEPEIASATTPEIPASPDPTASSQPGRKAFRWIPILTGGSALVAIAAIGLAIFTSRRRQQGPHILPESPPARRLGAPHSGGAGAEISVAEAEVAIKSDHSAGASTIS